MTLSLFTDASFDPLSRKGIAGILLICEELDLSLLEEYSEIIQTKFVSESTNVRVEIEAILWGLFCAVDKFPGEQVNVYTDCETAVGLKMRRARLETNDYKSKRTGLMLTNADLYKKMYELLDHNRIEIFHVTGHSPSSEKELVERIFSLVDKKTRHVLRKSLAP